MQMIWLAVSVIFFLIAVGTIISGYLKRRNGENSNELLWGSLWMFLCCTALIFSSEQKSGFFLPAVLQVFSLDFGYEDFAVVGIEALPEGMRTLISVYYHIALTAAPIVGGAMILEILAGVSTNVRLMIVRLFKKTPVYVFSELNEKSIVLAEDVKRHSNGVIVFVDCFGEGSDERSGELHSRADVLHAICTENDILHNPWMTGMKNISYYLMDCDENGEFDEAENLIAYDGLLNLIGENTGKTQPVGEIYLFTNEISTMETMSCIKKEQETVLGEKCKDLHVHVVRDRAFTAEKLLTEYPLYEHLSCGEGARVRILGDHGMTEEILKAAYWLGQMEGHKLQVTCITTPEEGGRMEKHLKETCPELLASCTKDDPTLLLDPVSGLYGDVYADIDFREMEADQVGNDPDIVSGNYFVVAYKDSMTSVKAADDLWRALEKRNIANAFIAVYLEDDKLSEAMAKKIRVKLDRNPQNHTGICLFGKNEIRYSEEMLSDYRDQVLGVHGLNELSSSVDSLYNELLTAARSKHMSYKLDGVKDVDGAAIWEQYKADKASGKLPVPPAESEKLMDGYRHIEGSAPEMLQYAALTSRDEENIWLEHRRWCAFLRTLGFTQPYKTPERVGAIYNDHSLLKTLTEQESDLAYKNVYIKIHPCLVETRVESDAEDYLDVVSAIRGIYTWRKTGKAGEIVDLKKYDRPVYSFDKTVRNVDAYLVWAGVVKEKRHISLFTDAERIMAGE